MQPPVHSLRARLLWSLLAAISAAALAQALVAYRTARAEADTIFDYHMAQTAIALRDGLPLDAPGAAAATATAPQGEENFDLVVQVWGADGQRLIQSAHVGLPRLRVPGFSTLRAHGTTYRVYALPARERTIEVAQDMAARDEMAGALALRTAAPIAVMAPLLMLAVWAVVGASLAPVSRVRRQVAQRQADDLGEVSEAGLPDEIRPLVHELNLLFGRVRQAFDAQQSFVADAAHELRSPLAALKLQAQALQRAPDEAARQVAVGRLTAGIDRATRLVEQLLVLARQQSHAAAGSKGVATALAELVRQSIADAAPVARASHVDLGLTHADDGRLNGHPEALRILLRNLLDNAIKHTPAGGRIDVEVRRERADWVLRVQDSGPGIPSADLARAPDRFYRVAGTATTGSGLGLAIVKSIADLHAARLVLDRSPDLGGLRAEVRFPAGGG
ncbi:MAG: sensor histidine kinase N-terminal domain-containing protein [Burkholderiales bacterium]|nr:sensor histidine kinase N-terminal domain-containing protein [Burkholderiales bacterium]